MNELAVSGGGGGWWGWSCRWGIMLEWEGLYSQGHCRLRKTWNYSWCIVLESKLASNMVLGQEVLDSNTSVVLVG